MVPRPGNLVTCNAVASICEKRGAWLQAAQLLENAQRRLQVGRVGATFFRKAWVWDAIPRVAKGTPSPLSTLRNEWLDRAPSTSSRILWAELAFHTMRRFQKWLIFASWASGCKPASCCGFCQESDMWARAFSNAHLDPGMFAAA